MALHQRGKSQPMNRKLCAVGRTNKIIWFPFSPFTKSFATSTTHLTLTPHVIIITIIQPIQKVENFTSINNMQQSGVRWSGSGWFDAPPTVLTETEKINARRRKIISANNIIIKMADLHCLRKSRKTNGWVCVLYSWSQWVHVIFVSMSFARTHEPNLANFARIRVVMRSRLPENTPLGLQECYYGTEQKRFGKCMLCVSVCVRTSIPSNRKGFLFLPFFLFFSFFRTRTTSGSEPRNIKKG